MRSRIAALLLCLALVTSGASAMGMPSAVDQRPGGSGWVDLVWTFFQDLVGAQIDPWGDEGTTARPDGEAGGDVGMKIDPWG